MNLSSHVIHFLGLGGLSVHHPFHSVPFRRNQLHLWSRRRWRVEWPEGRNRKGKIHPCADALAREWNYLALGRFFQRKKLADSARNYFESGMHSPEPACDPLPCPVSCLSKSRVVPCCCLVLFDTHTEKTETVPNNNKGRLCWAAPCSSCYKRHREMLARKEQEGMGKRWCYSVDHPWFSFWFSR